MADGPRLQRLAFFQQALSATTAQELAQLEIEFIRRLMASGFTVDAAGVITIVDPPVLDGSSITNLSGANLTDGSVTYAKMQDVSAASKLLGRGDSGSGDVEEITLGSGLSMSGTTLSASAAPGGSDTHVQFNDGGAIAGEAGLTYDKTTDALTVAGSVVTPAVNSNASVAVNIDADNNSTTETFKIRANGSTDVVTVTETGQLTTVAGVVVQGGTFSSGSMTVRAAEGLSIRGAAGSGADLSLFNGGGSSVADVPTGTVRFRVYQGVQFPSSQSASTDVNTLDDYEEGTWTPVLGGSGGTSGQTYASQHGEYVKIGKLVFIAATITLSAKGTITDQLRITGLPFTAGSADDSAGSFGDFDATSGNISWISGTVDSNATWVRIRYKDTDAATSMSNPTTAIVTNSTACEFMAMYRAAA